MCDGRKVRGNVSSTREWSMMLNAMESLSEIIFKVSHEYSNKYCTYFIKAPLMETVSARCQKVRGEKGGLAEKCLATERRQEVG